MERTRYAITAGLIILLLLTGCIEKREPPPSNPIDEVITDFGNNETNETITDPVDDDGSALGTIKSWWNKPSVNAAKSFFKEIFTSFLGEDAFMFVIAAGIIVAIIMAANHLFNGALWLFVFLLVLWGLKAILQ